MAPQTTGHPAGLPADPAAPVGDITIAPAAQNADTSGAESRNHGGESSAPPSAMQLKIMEILERQAQELDQG